MRSNFNIEEYKRILDAANAKSYQFVSFCEKDSHEKYILLRHDIDADLTAALEIAKVEFDKNVKSTFFLMMHSPLYNLFSRSNFKIVNEILNMGHYLGLHFDELFYQDDCKKLQARINYEISIFENLFNKNVSAVSFHQPSKRVINNEIVIDQINTYDKTHMSGIKYISDTNMNWREETPFELFDNPEQNKIQLLIHPIWWIGEYTNTEDKWDKAIESNFYREQKQLLETERAYGTKRCIIIKK